MTANLRVGIDTSEAFASLKALRAEMQNQPHNLLISVDAKSVDREIAGYLKQRSFKVKVDTRAMGAEIENDVGLALDRAFNREGRRLAWNVAALRGGMNSAIDPIFSDSQRRLRFDAAALAAQVRTAIEAGMTVGTIKVTGAVGAVAGGGGIDQASMNLIREKLAPAVDAMVAAANQVAAAARSARVASSSGGLTASESVSLRDPNSGRTTRVNRRLENPELVLDTVTMANKLAAQEKLALQGALYGPDREIFDKAQAFKRAEQTKLNDLGLLYGPDRSVFEAAQALRRAEQAKFDQQGLLYGPDRSVFDSAQAMRRAEQQKLNQLGLLYGPDRSTLEAAQALRRAEQAKLDQQGMLYGPDRSVFDKAQALKRAEQTKLNDLGLLYGPDRVVFEKALAAKRAAEARLQTPAGDFGPDRSTFDASRAAARAAQERLNVQGWTFGPDRSTLEANNAISAQKAHKQAVTENAEAHRVLAGSMREAHSAARGLAGSMGAMWATYGSVVPLVAAASLGAAMKIVVGTGKDLEYQLTFVSALTDRSVVSTERLAQAIAGSVVAPVQAAEAMRGLAQNGLSVNEAFQALPSILNLATAGEMTLSEAALGATGVMAAFNKTVADLGQIGDVFAKAAAMSNTDVKSMVEAMKQASTVGDQFNVTMEETSAALAVMAKRNITGTAAGTAFRNMMKELASPTKQAKQAIEDLGLKFFDVNGKLLPLEQNMAQVAKRMASLNEESKLAFIDRIFGERGGKAANAILSDLSAFSDTLDTLKTKATGFSKEVTDALALTTEGRIKLLVSEFKTNAAKAFDDASGGVNNFIEALRELGRSKGMLEVLQLISNQVLRLTTFLIEHGDAVKNLLLIWAGAKALSFVVTQFVALRAAITSATAATVTLGTAARTSLAAMTGGLSLVIGLGLEYLLLSRNINKATEAEEAHYRFMRNENATLDERIAKLREENVQIERKLGLMRGGKTEAEANKILEREQLKKQVADSEAEAAAKRAQLERAEENYRPGQYGSGRGTAAQAQAEARQLAEINKLREQLQVAEANAEKKRIEQRELNFGRMNTLEVNRVAQIQAFERQVAEAQAAGVQVGDILQTAGLKGAHLTQEQFENNLQVARERLNALKEKRGLPTNGAEAHAEDAARSRQLISQLNDEEKAMEQYIKFRKQLDDAKYNPALYGDSISAAMAEQRQIIESTNLLKLQESQIKRLKDLKDDKTNNLKDPDRINLQTEINKREAEFALNQRELDQLKELAKIKAEVKQIQDASAFNKERTKLSSDDAFAVRKIRESYQIKAESGRDAKMTEAARAADERYRSAELDHRARLKTLEEAEVRLQAEKTEILSSQYEYYDADHLAKVEAGLEATRKDVALEQTKLAILLAQARASQTRARQVAGEEFDNSQTAQYGMMKFWEEYKDSALSNAKIVEGVMKSTTSNMSDYFAQFVTTGDHNFKQFAKNIAATAAKMLADKAIAQLLGLAVNYVSGLSSGGSGFNGGTVGVNGDAGITTGTTYQAAHGGVYTTSGPLPLRYYAKGGVEYGPAVTVHGEGSLPEANVPLQDGRTIPVTLSGAIGGGSPVTVNMSVRVDGNGKSDVESDTSGQKASQLGQMLDDAVVSVIQREKRPGGLLYA